MQFIYLDPREEGENIIVYITVVAKKIIQENENKGRKQILLKWKLIY